MKGLELARQYYDAFGKEMLETRFPEAMPFLAIGLSGSGSECYGYDDATSRDHDFEPGFCLFLPGEEVIDRKTAFQLERAYAKLPREFMGFRRHRMDPVGGSRHGVIRMEDFFLAKTGTSDGNLSLDQWFSVPETGLLEATNGAVFADPHGQFTSIRERLRYFPEDVRQKKLAGYLLLMGQSGQYNYGRCLSRKDTAAAQLAVFEFVQSTLHTVYLLNRTYMPYYKWCFRGLRDLPRLSHLSEALECLISSGNTAEEACRKTEMIQQICVAVADELQEQGGIESTTADMERLAYAVNHTVADPSLRNCHILCGV